MEKTVLKVSQADFTDKKDRLQKQLTRCDTTIDNYEAKLNELDEYVDGDDDMYEQYRTSIQQNIKAVRHERKIIDAAMNALQKEMDGAKDAVTAMNNAINAAKESSESKLSAGLSAVNTLN